MLKGKFYGRIKKIHKDSKLILKKLKKGSLFFTPPMQEHFAYFIKDSHILAFSPRTGKKRSYENDLIRVNMQNYPKLKEGNF